MVIKFHILLIIGLLISLGRVEEGASSSINFMIITFIIITFMIIIIIIIVVFDSFIESLHAARNLYSDECSGFMALGRFNC